jgi:hypothetical protein
MHCAFRAHGPRYHDSRMQRNRCRPRVPSRDVVHSVSPLPALATSCHGCRDASGTADLTYRQVRPDFTNRQGVARPKITNGRESPWSEHIQGSRGMYTTPVPPVRSTEATELRKQRIRCLARCSTTHLAVLQAGLAQCRAPHLLHPCWSMLSQDGVLTARAPPSSPKAAGSSARSRDRARAAIGLSEPAYACHGRTAGPSPNTPATSARVTPIRRCPPAGLRRAVCWWASWRRRERGWCPSLRCGGGWR